MVPISTKPATEMSTRSISWGLKGPVPKATKITAFMCQLSRNYGSFNILDPEGFVQTWIEIVITLAYAVRSKRLREPDD
jgi:hypothetical protein